MQATCARTAFLISDSGCRQNHDAHYFIPMNLDFWKLCEDGLVALADRRYFGGIGWLVCVAQRGGWRLIEPEDSTLVSRDFDKQHSLHDKLHSPPLVTILALAIVTTFQLSVFCELFHISILFGCVPSPVFSPIQPLARKRRTKELLDILHCILSMEHL